MVPPGVALSLPPPARVSLQLHAGSLVAPSRSLLPSPCLCATARRALSTSLHGAHTALTRHRLLDSVARFLPLPSRETRSFSLALSFGQSRGRFSSLTSHHARTSRYYYLYSVSLLLTPFAGRSHGLALSPTPTFPFHACSLSLSPFLEERDPCPSSLHWISCHAVYLWSVRLVLCRYCSSLPLSFFARFDYALASVLSLFSLQAARARAIR